MYILVFMLNCEVSECIISRNTLYVIISTKILMVTFTIFKFTLFRIIVLYYNIYIYIYIYIYILYINIHIYHINKIFIYIYIYI